MKQISVENIHTGLVEGRIYPGLAKNFHLDRLHLAQNRNWKFEPLPIEVGCRIRKEELGKLIAQLQYVHNKMT